MCPLQYKFHFTATLAIQCYEGAATSEGRSNSKCTKDNGVCIKIAEIVGSELQHIQFTVLLLAEDSVYAYSCAESPGDGSQMQCKSVDDAGKTSTVCICNTDLCNAANVAGRGAALVMLMMLMAVFGV